MPNDAPHSFTLGPNSYGKAGVRLVRVGRETPRHELRDLTVRTALSGDFDATHRTGDNTGVLPTDTQKNTVYALAREGIGAIESFAERLARHFTDRTATVASARVAIEERAWTRIGAHSFTRGEGGELRTTEVVYDGRSVAVVSGVRDLLLLNTTDSEFSGFLADEYTTLPETDDRILATAVTATWTYPDVAGLGTAGGESETGTGASGRAPVADRTASAATSPGARDHAEAFYDRSFAAARAALLEAFADTYSLSLQQTLYAVGERILRAVPEAGEVRLSLPNRHHYLFDLERFGLDNPGVVFQAGDLPYGLIEGTVRREPA